MILLRWALLFLSFSAAFAEVDPVLLSEQTRARFEKVPEFEFIIQEANKLGVKVYLFGGTASAFAHYVRWDLERETGDDKYQAERFDYDFTNIYRGNQDLDIVVDGTSDQADQLQKILQETYPHFIGDRDAWEVRLLRESRGDKQALLGDEDFKKQHSDTNSTGMLLLNPDFEGIVYNDLLNWGSHESDFLNDVAAARIKFLYGKEHKQTKRYKEDKNPPVLAAMRYLAKLAQYEVEGSEDDLQIVTQIIKETNFLALSNYSKRKAEEFALKTLLNAPDSEYAWNLLEETGARLKLIEMDGERLEIFESLSWWLNKEPLRSKPFGKEGKTAREIFGHDEIIVSHETKNFKAYENITRSSKGSANAFISRGGVEGEAAVHGNGFYTRMGKMGAANTGITIRFKLHPEAREDEDFEIFEDFVIIKNKKALTLIQENLNLSLKDFLKLIVLNRDLKSNDKGLLEKFSRKFRRVSSSHEEFKEAFLYVKSLFEIPEALGSDLKYDFEEIENYDFDSLMKMVFEKREDFYRDFVAPRLLRKEHFPGYFEFIEKLINENVLHRFFVEDIIDSSETWLNRPDLILKIIKGGQAKAQVFYKILRDEAWLKKHPILFESFIDHTLDPFPAVGIELSVLFDFFSKEPWNQRLDLLVKMLYHSHDHQFPWRVANLIRKKEIYPNVELFKALFLKLANPPPGLFEILKEDKNFSQHPDLIRMIVDRQFTYYPDYIANYLLAEDEWFQYRDIVEKTIERGSLSTLIGIIKNAFPKEKKERLDDDLFKRLFDKKGVDEEMVRHFLADPEWEVPDAYLEMFIMNHRAYAQIAISVFSQQHWSHRYDLLEYFISKAHPETIKNLIIWSLSKEHWSDFPQIIEQLIEEKIYDQNIVRSILSKPHWIEKHPHLLLRIIENHSSSGLILDFGVSLLPKPFKSGVLKELEKLISYHQQHPILLKYLEKDKVTLEALRDRMKVKDYRKWFESYYSDSNPQMCKSLLK